jgi:hypothetical protein
MTESEEVMAKDSNELFVERVDTPNRHYFFDVKASANGNKYLVITESRMKENKWERSKVFVFEENLSQFNDGLDKALKFIADSTK